MTGYQALNKLNDFYDYEKEFEDIRKELVTVFTP
jgi:hypothetical protein